MKTLLLIFVFISLSLSCDYVDKSRNCCDDNECTGTICQKGCGMACCGKMSRKIYDFACKALVKGIASKIVPVFSCFSWGIAAYEVCTPVAAPTLIWGQIGCAAVGIALFGGCSVYESAIAEPLCNQITKRLPRSRLLPQISNYTSQNLPKFPENYTMNLTTYFNKSLIRTSIIKSKDDSGAPVVFYQNVLQSGDESVFYFNFDKAGKTLNLTAGNCSSTRGFYEPLDMDFLEFFAAKLNISEPFGYSSLVEYQNKTAEKWIAKKYLNDSRYAEVQFLYDRSNNSPLEFQVFLNNDSLLKMTVEVFSQDASINFDNEYFKKCDLCSNLTSCDQIKDFPQCGWCPSKQRAFLIDPRNEYPEFPNFCESNHIVGQWTSKLEDCECLKMTQPEDINKGKNCGWCPIYNRSFLGNEKGPILGVSCPATAEFGQWIWKTKNVVCLKAKSCEELKGTDCGWCPTLNKAFLGNFDDPFDGIVCPMGEEGQWTYYTSDCVCSKAKSCHELQGTNCGWCSSLNKAFFGNKQGPFWEVKCPVEGYKQWIFNKNCKCMEATKCGDIAETDDCGWCPSLKKGLIGTFNSPNDGIECPTNEEGQWTFYTKDCACLSANKCEDLQNTNCGWCNSKKKAMIGTKNGPLFNATCSNIDSNQWIFNKDCPCLSATKCDDLSKSETCGWCPSLKRGLLGDFNGPFGNITCPTTEEGQWTYYTKDCACLSANKCEDLQSTNCGWCISKQKPMIGTKKLPLFNASCPNLDNNQWIFNKDCPCLTAQKCEDLSKSETCGWCPSLKRGLLGDFNGPFGNITCPFTEEGQWTYSTNDCLCAKLTKCEDISGKQNCGWCIKDSKSYIGNAKEPFFGAKCDNEWIWSARDCPKTVMKSIE